MYMFYVLCFQSGGGGTTKMQEEKGLLKTNCLQVHGTGEVTVVSKPLPLYIITIFFLYYYDGAVTTFFSCVSDSNYDRRCYCL